MTEGKTQRQRAEPNDEASTPTDRTSDETDGRQGDETDEGWGEANAEASILEPKP